MRVGEGLEKAPDAPSSPTSERRYELTMTPTSSPVLPSARQLRVLLVDDDEFMLKFVADMLADLGVGNVTTALDGREGMAAFQRLSPKPDLVLCDINMPDTDGFQFMEQIADQGFKGGIVLVSGMDERTRTSAALMGRFHRLNVLATIGKPIAKRALADALARAA
jgi:CheY-like chemotaxis protein